MFEGGVEATDFHPPLWKSFLSLKVLFCFFPHPDLFVRLQHLNYTFFKTCICT